MNQNPTSEPPTNDPPVRPEVVSAGGPAPAAQGSPVVIVQSTGAFSRWLSWLGWVGCFFCVFVIIGLFARYNDYFNNDHGIQEKYHSRSKTSKKKIAIINIKGLIATGEGYVKSQIERAREDKSVKAIVLRIDSPGGTITGSDYIYHHLRELKKERQIPFVVSMGSIATSGGYYVAMAVGDAEKTIFAEPTTTTGSIGVIIPHYDLSGLLERFDVRDDSIVSHPRKKMLSMTRPISADDRIVLERYLQEAFGRFKDIVKSGRPLFREDEEKLDQLATGEIFTATQAVENGLIDELGFIEEAIDRAVELANLDSDKVRVVTYRAPVTLMDALTSARVAAHSTLDVNSILELSAPKAYYLSTSIPPILSTRDGL